jgi:hypothetical protein
MKVTASIAALAASRSSRFSSSAHPLERQPLELRDVDWVGDGEP